MKGFMFSLLYFHLFVYSLCTDSFATRSSESDPKHFAVIGSGIGGSSAAYFIRKNFPESEITIFEKDQIVGGRIADFNFNGTIIDYGAGVYHTVNKLMFNWRKEFGLQTAEEKNRGNFFIWDGEKFVFTQSSWKAMTVAKMVYQYGLSPYWVDQLATEEVDKLVKLYDMDNSETWEKVEDFYSNLNMSSPFVKAKEGFMAKGIGEAFIDQVLAPITRTIYGQKVTAINYFATVVSLYGESDKDLFKIEGGNRQIVLELIKRAEAILRTNTAVKNVKKTDSGSYEISTEHGNKDEYDGVIVAAPLELTDIKFENIERNPSKNRKFRKTFVTFVAGNISTEYFSLESQNNNLGALLTTENEDIPFSSIGYQGTIANNQKLYKVFSRAKLSDETVNLLFKDIQFTKRHEWDAYPFLDPMSSDDAPPPVVLDKRLFYPNALEATVSTMETAAVSSKNAVNLLCKSFGFVCKY